MRILYVAHTYKPAYRGGGGPILSIAAAAEGLVRKGHEVTLFTVNENDVDGVLDVPLHTPVIIEGVEVWYFPQISIWKQWLPFITYMSKSFGYLYSPAMAQALNHKVKEVDLVHTQIPFTHLTLAAGQAAFRHGVPLVYHQRGVLDPERLHFRAWKKRLYIWLFELQLLRKASCLISLTEAETASYRALGALTRCEVIPNGINVDEYWQETPEDWLGKLELAPDAQVILFLGRLHPIKGADRLVRAFLAIQERFPKAVLVCAGPDEFNIRGQLDRMITDGQESVRSRVLFPGMVTGELKKAMLARADLFCLPSDAEGFSMAVLEAMASRTAVLLSPGCHFDEVMAAGAGMVVSKDSEAIATALAELLSDSVRLRRMGDAALDLVQRLYSWDPLVDRLVSVYQQCIREMRAS